MLKVCLEHNVQAVAIDAPCKWRAEGSARSAERELSARSIFCFATPTKACASESRFHAWMLNGAEVYQAFSSDYPLLETAQYQSGRVSFETFPHAVTCALRGKEETSAKEKRRQRSEVLRKMGIDISDLTSIDDLDAALCALTSRFLLKGETKAYGDAMSGYIHVPNTKHVALWG